MYCFHFLQETLISVFLPPSDSLKTNHDTNYLMKSEDPVGDRLMSVQIYLKSKVFFISSYSPSTAYNFGDEIVRTTGR